MQEIVEMIDKDSRYIEHTLESDTIKLRIKRSKATGICPYFCINKGSKHKTFAEHFDLFRTNARKTNLLQSEIPEVSLTQSSVTTSNHLRKNVANVGKSTICNLLKKELAHPKAKQVSNKFHIIKNLHKRATLCFQELFQGRVSIPLTSQTASRREVMSMGNKVEKTRLVKEIRAEGRSLDEIRVITGAGAKTVKIYIAMREEEMPEQKQTVRGHEHEEAIDKVKGISQAQLDAVITDCPVAGNIYSLVNEFKELFKQKKRESFLCC